MSGWPLTYCVVKGERELLILLQGPPFFSLHFHIFCVYVHACTHACIHAVARTLTCACIHAVAHACGSQRTTYGSRFSMWSLITLRHLTDPLTPSGNSKVSGLVMVLGTGFLTGEGLRAPGPSQQSLMK